MVKHSRGIWALNNKPLAWQVGAACEDVTRVKHIDLRNAILEIISRLAKLTAGIIIIFVAPVSKLSRIIHLGNR